MSILRCYLERVLPAFGRYRTTAELGRGAMGEVYLAVDDVLGREVAIKTLRPQYFGLLRLDERFRNEARAIATLSHPGIVQVYDLDLASEPPFLVLERVAGPSLDKRIEQGPLPASEVIALGIQIGRALAAAHVAGIVHRDVKPANILCAGPGRWKLADFGVAHVPDSSLTMTGQFVGSPAYAPPEALAAGATGTQADVYGLGATLYEAASGAWPRVGGSAALFEPVEPLRAVAPSVPAELAAAIDRAVADDPNARPSAAELADLLARGPGDPSEASSAATRVSLRVDAPARSRWWRPVALALFVAVCAAGLAVAIVGARSAPASEAATSPVDKPEASPPPPRSPEDDEHREHDWEHVWHDYDKGHAREALRKLDDYERRYGVSPETTQLRDDIGKLPPEPGPPGPPGHGKHH